MSETKKTKSFFKSDRNKIVAVVLASTLVIGGSFGVQAVASSKTFQHLHLAASEPSETASFFHKAGWPKGHRHGHRMRFSEMSDGRTGKVGLPQNI